MTCRIHKWMLRHRYTYLVLTTPPLSSAFSSDSNAGFYVIRKTWGSWIALEDPVRRGYFTGPEAVVPGVTWLGICLVMTGRAGWLAGCAGCACIPAPVSHHPPPFSPFFSSLSIWRRRCSLLWSG